MTELPEFILQREFKAPKDLVWKVFTDPELLSRWYGPEVETIIHKLDVRPGGEWLNEMKMGGGSSFERMAYTEVVESEKLVWHHSMTDQDWQPAPNPRMPDWPKVLLTTVTFIGAEDTTKMKLSWVPFNASQAEIDCFAGAMEGLQFGWGKGMEVLEEVLAELQA